MAKCVRKYVITVPIILHATLVMGTVNVCLAGQQVTAQNVSFCSGRLSNNLEKTKQDGCFANFYRKEYIVLFLLAGGICVCVFILRWKMCVVLCSSVVWHYIPLVRASKATRS